MGLPEYSLIVDTKNAEELRALTAYESALALNEIIADLTYISKCADVAVTREFEAKKTVLTVADSDLKRAKVDLLTAQMVVRHYKNRASLRREQKSILQSLLKTIQ